MLKWNARERTHENSNLVFSALAIQVGKTTKFHCKQRPQFIEKLDQPGSRNNRNWEFSPEIRARWRPWFRVVTREAIQRHERRRRRKTWPFSNRSVRRGWILNPRSTKRRRGGPLKPATKTLWDKNPNLWDKTITRSKNKFAHSFVPTFFFWHFKGTLNPKIIFNI